MKRLTCKPNLDIYGEHYYFEENEQIFSIVDKLGKLENIEEEWGLPLDAFVKILLAYIRNEALNVFFGYGEDERDDCFIRPQDGLDLKDKYIAGWDNITDNGWDGPDGQFFEDELYFKDYGKTWSLERFTKESK